MTSLLPENASAPLIRARGSVIHVHESWMVSGEVYEGVVIQ